MEVYIKWRHVEWEISQVVFKQLKATNLNKDRVI